MKKLLIILSIVILTGCQASKTVCTTHPQTIADTLPESTPMELTVGSAFIFGLTILFVSSIK